MDAGDGVHSLLVPRQLQLGGPDPRGSDRHYRHLHRGVVSPAEEEAPGHDDQIRQAVDDGDAQPQEFKGEASRAAGVSPGQHHVPQPHGRRDQELDDPRVPRHPGELSH